MLEKLKQFRLAITAGIIALAYFLGIKKGKENEKAKQNKKLLENMAQARKARNTLRNPNTTKRLHDKYRR